MNPVSNPLVGTTYAAESIAPLLDSEIDWNLQPVDETPADPDPLVAALIDMLAYRSLLQAALDQLRDLTLQLDRERQMRLSQLREYRWLRSSQR